MCWSTKEASEDLAVSVRLPSAPEILRQSTAVQNSRYDQDSVVYPSAIRVPSVLYALTPILSQPMEWTAHVHPEGARYYVHNVLGIVTNAPLHIPSLYDRLCIAIAEVGGIIAELQCSLPHDYEVHLQLDYASNRCDYYAIDHDKQREFWFMDSNSDELKLPAVTSLTHLEHTLQEHYWTHVEFYPHRPVAKHLRQELLSVLRHAQADHLTSDSSTFPFDAKQCATFIKLINLSDEACENSYMTSVIARIWTTVCLHRFQNYYGEDYARLCRDQRCLEASSIQPTFLMRACFIGLFNMPNSFKADLDGLFIDNLLHIIHWRTFSNMLRTSWKTSCIESVSLIIINGILLGLSRTYLSSYTCLASLVLSAGSLYTSFNLLEQYSGAETYTASIVADHLDKLKQTVGFDALAALFALPKALVGWSIIFLCTGIIGIVFETIGLWVAILPTIAIALGATIYVLHLVISCIHTMFDHTQEHSSEV
ncbi:unnamed protein product [Somion occarium]